MAWLHHLSRSCAAHKPGAACRPETGPRQPAKRLVKPHICHCQAEKMITHEPPAVKLTGKRFSVTCAQPQEYVPHRTGQSSWLERTHCLKASGLATSNHHHGLLYKRDTYNSVCNGCDCRVRVCSCAATPPSSLPALDPGCRPVACVAFPAAPVTAAVARASSISSAARWYGWRCCA
jgi:hypothetical protein